MNQHADLSELLDLDMQPLYNIKAVVEATGLPAATLRAWERRYGVLAPGRTDSGYRLYSARDIARLRWLKARLAEGMTISQAIAWLSQHTATAQSRPLSARREAQGLSSASEMLLRAWRSFDELRASQVLEEAFAAYGIELTVERVLAPVLEQIDDVWQREDAGTAAAHFAHNFLLGKLDAIINAWTPISRGPLVVLGCAADEWHDLGLVLMHLLLRRRGINTLDLGQNVPVTDFAEGMAQLQPAMIVITATSAPAVAGVTALAQVVNALPAPTPLFGYGGRAFNVHPELRAQVPGIFLGESVQGATAYIATLLKLD